MLDVIAIGELLIDFASVDVNEEGYPVDITMEIVYTTWAGAKWDCNATATMVYNDPGQPVTVEIPDASEYIEVDPETMS